MIETMLRYDYESVAAFYADSGKVYSFKGGHPGDVIAVRKKAGNDVAGIRVHSAISKAENERLRAKNSLLEYQNSETERYRTAMESGSVVVIENDWLSGTFIYDPAISKHIAEQYDARGFWHILLSDFVAETATVQKMQNLMQKVASTREQLTARTVIRLKRLRASTTRSD